MNDGRAPLKHLMPGWFASVMGWSGLALASLLLLALTLATLHGLRAGTLLVPEVAPVIPLKTQA